MAARRAIIAANAGADASAASNYSSAQVQVFPAMKTGRVNLITNAMARELITDERRQSHGRFLYRQGHAHRKADQVPHGGAGGELLRIGAPAAQFEIPASLERPGEFVGRGGSLSHRQHRVRPGRRRFRRCTACRVTTRTAWAARICTCRGGCGTRRRDFPRGYHIEIGGGYGMPGIGQLRGRGQSRRRIRRAAQEDDLRGLRHARQLRRPRRDDPQRRHLLRNRSDTWSISGASRC